MQFLFIGSGSIGERHIRNLKSILKQVDIFVVEKNTERLKMIVEKYNVIPVFDLSKIIKEKKFDGAFVCTPPSSHIKIATLLVKYKIPLFIEKPLSNSQVGLNELIEITKNNKVPVLVGYNLHFHPGLILLKKILAEKKIGRILSIRIEAGQYLPDWRPWQDYRTSYTARKELGGGIILDGSHEINYLLWLLNDRILKEVFCFSGIISDLKVNTEDTAEILLKFDKESLVNIHLDFIQRVYSRTCKIIGSEGTICWDYSAKEVKVYLARKKEWKTFKFKNQKFEANDLYINELKHFLKVIKNKAKPLISLQEAAETLRVALLAKKSNDLGKIIRLP